MKIQIPDEVFGVKEWECEVISNENVATFIKELVLKLPEGENVRFKLPPDFEKLPIPEDQVSMSREESIEAEMDEIVPSIISEEDLEIKIEKSTSNSSTEEFILDQIKD